MPDIDYFSKGREDHAAGVRRGAGPTPADSENGRAWRRGWDTANGDLPQERAELPQGGIITPKPFVVGELPAEVILPGTTTAKQAAALSEAHMRQSDALAETRSHLSDDDEP